MRGARVRRKTRPLRQTSTAKTARCPQIYSKVSAPCATFGRTVALPQIDGGRELMRKRLLVGVLGFALIAASMFPFAQSGAQQPPEGATQGQMDTPPQKGDMGAGGAR